MARTDNDSWDLASSVGATATMVAAQRVLADREGLIDDPFAEPLVRAVGLDFFVRALDGEINLEDVDPRFSLRARRTGHGGAHTAFRQAVHRCRGRRRPSGGDSGGGAGRTGLPVAVARRHDRRSRSTSPR